MVTVIRTAVTVKASRKADKNAAEITKRSDKRVFDLMACKSFVKMTISRFFMKKIAETIKTKSKITSKLVFISYSTCSGLVKPSNSAWKAIRPPGCKG